MIILKYNGRLGNRMFQYAAAYLLSLKTGSKIFEGGGRFSTNVGHKLGKEQDFKDREADVASYDICCENKDGWIMINSYSKYLNALQNPDKNAIYVIKAFLVDRERAFEHTEDKDIESKDLNVVKYRKEILDLYNCEIEKQRYNHDKNEAFIHARLGDTYNRDTQYCQYFNFNYLRNKLNESRSEFSKVYISSDSPTNRFVKQFCKEYDLTLYHSSPIETIIFGSCFNNLILSTGTFSFWIGYLSSAENISVWRGHRDKHRAWEYYPGKIDFHYETEYSKKDKENSK